MRSRLYRVKIAHLYTFNSDPFLLNFLYIRMQSLKAWLLTPALLLLGLGINETLLSAARHEPSVVSDADLFCNIYVQVQDLDQNDIVLLGASRMQTGFDLSQFHQQFPGRTALLLAQSGRDTSYPVFKDIVKNTDFRGVVLIDETESTLVSQFNDQQPFIDHCHTSFSLNRQLNRDMNTWLQQRFSFLNPQSSSLRLWGNVIAQQELPEPFYTKTLPDRQQLTDYARADPNDLQALYLRRLEGVQTSVDQSFPSSEAWLNQTGHWKKVVRQFQSRGGRVIFVRMPISSARWEIEHQKMPINLYWQKFVTKLHVNSIHFADYPQLTAFKLLDTSHLDMHDRAAFTQKLLNLLQDELAVKSTRY